MLRRSKRDIPRRKRISYNLRVKYSKPDFFSAGEEPPKKRRIVKRAGTKKKKQRRGKREQFIPKVDKKKGEFQYTTENNTCCSMDCPNKITQSLRETLRDKYLSIGEEKLQNVYLTTMIKRSLPSKKKTWQPDSEPRLWINKFYLFPDEKPVRVCKKFFKDTFKIPTERLHSIITRDCIVKEESGIPSYPCKKDSEVEVLFFVKDHIKSFGFNITSDTKCNDHPSKYLCPGVNVRKMYRHYVMIRKQRGEVFVNESVYRKVFKQHVYELIHNPEKAKRASFTELNRKSWEMDQFRRLVELEYNFCRRSADMTRKYLTEDDSKSDDDMDPDE